MPAIAKATSARISFKNSLAVCSAIRRKKVSTAKKLLEDLLARKKSLRGKYYTNAVEKILEILKSAEANARVKGLAGEKLFIQSAKADKGEKFIRPKSRFKFRGREAKSTNIEITLEER